MKVIKSNTYNIISSEPFEIPFPVVFELLSGNTLLVEYTISEAGVVDYSFNPNANEKILTSIRRPLTLSDIYFLFSSRIFPDKTPYTAIEMERFEIEEYQQYAIIRKTRGMLPGDKYWFRFEGEYINYKTALHENRAYYENSYKKYLESIETASAAAVAEEAEIQEETTETLAEPLQPEMSKVDVDIMRDDMVNSLMSSLSNELKIQESIDPPEIVSDEKMSDDAIAVLLAASFASEPPVETTAAPAEVSESASSEKMSDDAIAALLAANFAPEPPVETTAAPAEVSESASSEKMSDDAIAALLAASFAPEPPVETTAAPAEVSESASSEKISDDAIAALFAQNQ